MQASVPDLADPDEPESTCAAGEGAASGLRFANRAAGRRGCLQQLFTQGWDQRGSLPAAARQCWDTDQAVALIVSGSAAPADDTLVVWGGESGRTVYCQGELTEKNWAGSPPVVLQYGGRAAA